MLPAILVVSVGMAAAVAPLTTAVLASVNARHAGAASGLNSALARLGGLIATAMIGGVISAKGEALFTAFHVAVTACTVAALAAGIAALLLVRSSETPAPWPDFAGCPPFVLRGQTSPKRLRLNWKRVTLPPVFCCRRGLTAGCSST